MKYELIKIVRCTKYQDHVKVGENAGSGKLYYMTDINMAYREAEVYNRDHICECQVEVREVEDNECV